jgi:3-oxoadipate enol-lactonase
MTLELYKESGSGPAVIFNHGTLMDCTMFDPQLAFLAANGYRAISQNSRVLLGAASRHKLEDLANDTAALGQKLGLSSYVVAGMSTGAFMAVDFALKYLDRADGFILIEGQACAYPEEAQEAFEAEFEKFNVDGMVSRERAEWAAPFCFGEHTYANNRGLVDHWIERWTTKIPSRAVWAQGTSWVRKPDLTERLREIDKPVLIIHAEGDLPVPIARAYSMLENLPDATLVKVPKSGHTSNLENAEVVNYAILGFMDRIYKRRNAG